jgi:hypothetical protein
MRSVSPSISNLFAITIGVKAPKIVITREQIRINLPIALYSTFLINPIAIKNPEL